MKKCICEVVFKDGQTMQIQADYYEDNRLLTEYYAYDGLEGIKHKIDEINFIKEIN
jgi:hypothetical protein